MTSFDGSTGTADRIAWHECSTEDRPSPTRPGSTQGVSEPWKSQDAGRAASSRFRSSSPTTKVSATSWRCSASTPTGSATYGPPVVGRCCATAAARRCTSSPSLRKLGRRSCADIWRAHLEHGPTYRSIAAHQSASTSGSRRRSLSSASRRGLRTHPRLATNSLSTHKVCGSSLRPHDWCLGLSRGLGGTLVPWHTCAGGRRWGYDNRYP